MFLRWWRGHGGTGRCPAMFAPDGLHVAPTVPLEVFVGRAGVTDFGMGRQGDFLVHDLLEG